MSVLFKAWLAYDAADECSESADEQQMSTLIIPFLGQGLKALLQFFFVHVTNIIFVGFCPTDIFFNRPRKIAKLDYPPDRKKLSSLI